MSLWGRSAGFCIALAIAATLPATPAAAASLWGVVIGVDDYQYVQKLDGAVDDARDIAQALHKAGARNVQLLINGAASRDAVLAAWMDVVSRAEPGDTVVFSFAGHGAQLHRDALGAMHRFVLLPGFNSEGPGTYERIEDAEFGGMFRSVPRLNIVFVIDSCNAGTMTRSYGKPSFKVRAVTVPPLRDDRLKGKVPAPSFGKEVTLPNVAHLGAVPADELDPEILIDGKPRGALSYAVSRAFEGMADTDRDGRIEAPELDSYLRAVVAERTDGQQHPHLAIRDEWTLTLKEEVLPKNSDVASSFPLQPVTVAIVNAGESGEEKLAQMLNGVRLTKEEEARFVWDVARGEIRTRLGDVVSYANRGQNGQRGFSRFSGPGPAKGDALQDLPTVQKVIDKMAVVESIKKEADKEAIPLRLVPDDKLHYLGAAVTFMVGSRSHSYLTIFNLASDGTVGFLYPLQQGGNKDPMQVPLGAEYRLAIRVEPPFGADHLVAIASDEALAGLHRRLAALDGKAAAGEIGRLLAEELSGRKYQIGIHPSFTAPKEMAGP